MPVIPPSYLLNTNYGLQLSASLGKSSAAQLSFEEAANQRLLARISSQGVLGTDPQTVLKSTRGYLSAVSPVLSPDIDIKTAAGNDEYIDDTGDSADSDSVVSRNDDRVLLEAFEKKNKLFLQSLAPPEPDSVLEIAKYPLPTRWIAANQQIAQKFVAVDTSFDVLAKKEEFVRVSDDGLIVNAVSSNKFGSPGTGTMASKFLLKSDNIVPRECGVFYYEVKVKTNIKLYNLCVGFAWYDSAFEARMTPSEANSKVLISDYPGYDALSYGYCGQSAEASRSNKSSKYGATFGHNDIIGCGVDFYNNRIFFTKNGEYLGPAFTDLQRHQYLVPVIGFSGAGRHEAGFTKVNSLTSQNHHHHHHRSQRVDNHRSSGFLRMFAENFEPDQNNNFVLHEIVTNFGYSVKNDVPNSASPIGGNFYYDINGYIASIKSDIYSEIYKTNAENAEKYSSSLKLPAKKKTEQQKNMSIPDILNQDDDIFSPTVKRENNKLVLKDFETKTVINSLIKNYLNHLGYTDTYKAFSQDLKEEVSTGEEVPLTQESANVDTKENHQKHALRELIFAGRTNEALKFLADNFNEFFGITKEDYCQDTEPQIRIDLLDEDADKNTAQSLVFELKCIKLMSMIRKCIDSNDQGIEDPINYSKYLMKQYSKCSAKSLVLKEIFKLLVVAHDKNDFEIMDIDGEDEVMEEEKPTEFVNPSFERLVKPRELEALKSRVTDKLISFLMSKMGQPSVTNLERLISATNYNLQKIKVNDLSDSVLFINSNKDVFS